MRARTLGIVVVAAGMARFAGSCGSITGVSDDAGSDTLPVSTGLGGSSGGGAGGRAPPVDGGRDVPADGPVDAPEDHPATGLGGSTGSGGVGVGGGGSAGKGAGGSGVGGMGVGGSGAGGKGAGGSGAGGMGVGGTGVGGTGAGGRGAGGMGVGGTGVGGTGAGGRGVGGMGVGGAGVGGMGVGGMGVGGMGVGGMGVGGAGVGGVTGMGGSMSTVPDAGNASDVPADAAVQPTLTLIWRTILSNVSSATSPGCVSCHGGNANIPNYTSVATSFATLVGDTAGVLSRSCPPGLRVTPGNAETSVLVNKLRAGSGFNLATVCGGNPMPSAANRRITLDQLHLIEDWINAGALNN